MEQIAEHKPGRSWRKLSKRALVWVVAVLLVLSSSLLLWGEIKKYQTFERNLTDFQGVKIGASMAEVQYAFGVPKHVLAPPSPDDLSGIPAPPNGYLLTYDVEATSGPNQMPPGKTAANFNAWSWDEAGTARTDVTFDPKSRNVIEITCFVGDAKEWSDCWTVGGLHSGMTEQEAIDALGRPDTSFYDGITKMMAWKAVGVQLFLTKRVVYQIGKSTPEGADFRWWLTHGRP